MVTTTVTTFPPNGRKCRVRSEQYVRITAYYLLKGVPNLSILFEYVLFSTAFRSGEKNPFIRLNFDPGLFLRPLPRAASPPSR